MKKIIYLVIGVLLNVANLYAQDINTLDNRTIIGVYTIKNQKDTMKVWIDNKRTNKKIYFEYLGMCTINTLEFLARTSIGAKKSKISELISTLTYIRDKAKEWNSILDSRKIDTYNKEFKEADFPRLDMFVCVYNQTYPFYDNRHYITKAFFAKDKDHDNYKILLHVCGVQTIDRNNEMTMHVNNYIELNEEDINKLIMLLLDAGKLCEETTDVESLLTD